MAKPEAVAVRNVNSKLPKHVYHQGMAMTYGNGTPDQYYEGNKDCLFVEYKYAIKLPKVLELVNTSKSPHLSKLQATWLSRAYYNKRNVATILCTKEEGNYIFTGLSWENLWTKPLLLPLQLTRQEIANWIANQVSFSKT